MVGWIQPMVDALAPNGLERNPVRIDLTPEKVEGCHFARQRRRSDIVRDRQRDPSSTTRLSGTLVFRAVIVIVVTVVA